MKSKDILNIVYDQLDFNSGQLFDVTSQPLRKIGQDDWLNKGEWLTAAKRAGAEKIFLLIIILLLLFLQNVQKTKRIKLTILTNFGGKTEELCRQIFSWQKPVYAFESDYNKNLIEMDARPIKPENVSEWANFFHEDEK